jgi:hypothetical protein
MAATDGDAWWWFQAARENQNLTDQMAGEAWRRLVGIIS